MFYEQFNQYLPKTWTNVDPGQLEVEIHQNSKEFEVIVLSCLYAFPFEIVKITRVQNPYLYLQFLTKRAEYEARQKNAAVLQLYHVTDASNVPSIIEENFDLRFVSRGKYGQGVSFSPCPSYANSRSNESNGHNRALIVASVIVKEIEIVNVSAELPRPGFDTTSDSHGNTVVKYYDNEFYPNYVVYYLKK